MKPKKNYVPSGKDLCQTPPYALVPFFETFHVLSKSIIWEPCCGEGYLVRDLQGRGYDVIPTDILLGQEFDFFNYSPPAFNWIITNPPYSMKYKWLKRCYELGRPFALLMPVEVLGAASAQKLFLQYGISVVLLSRRVNFGMPKIGFVGSSAQFPVAWYVWDARKEYSFDIQIKELKNV